MSRMFNTEPLIRWHAATLAPDARELSNSSWSFAPNFRFAAHLTMVPIVPTEFSRVAREYPVGFIEFGNGCIPVALLGRKDPSSPFPNHFVDRSGRWNAEYVPFLVRVFPFTAELDPTSPSRFALRLVQESSCLRPGLLHPCQTNGAVSEETQAVATQIHRALDAFVEQAFAARTLESAGLMKPLQAGSRQGREGGIQILDPRKERLSYHLSPQAVQMAAAAFSSYKRTDLCDTAKHVTQAAQPSAGMHARVPVYQELSWLDFGDKIAF